MGIILDRPVDELLHSSFNWDSSVIGRFYGGSTPSTLTLQQLVDSQWHKRGPITVHKLGVYYIFFCDHFRDVEALLEQHTAIMDGRKITFRRGHQDIVPRDISFNIARLWVRVLGCRWDF